MDDAGSRLVALDCEGRSRCTAVLPFGASMGYADPVDVHVEWTLTVTSCPIRPRPSRRRSNSCSIRPPTPRALSDRAGPITPPTTSRSRMFPHFVHTGAKFVDDIEGPPAKFVDKRRCGPSDPAIWFVLPEGANETDRRGEG